MATLDINGRQYRISTTRLRLMLNGADVESITDANGAEILIEQHATPDTMAVRTARAVCSAWRCELGLPDTGAAGCIEGGTIRFGGAGDRWGGLTPPPPPQSEPCAFPVSRRECQAEKSFEFREYPDPLPVSLINNRFRRKHPEFPIRVRMLCPHCPASFCLYDRLWKHLVDDHGTDCESTRQAVCYGALQLADAHTAKLAAGLASVEQRAKCPDCDRTYGHRSKAAFAKHLATHAPKPQPPGAA